MASRPRPAKVPKPTPAKLRDAFLKDLPAAWAEARRRHPDETPYAFILYGVEDVPRLSPQVLTEEGLTKVAKRYLEGGYHDTLDEARRALRYSVADSPYVEELDDKIPTVDALFGPHAEALGETAGYKLLATATIEALERLDADGTFGKGPARNGLLLAILTEDVEVDWSATSVKKLNPEAVRERFEAETKVEGNFATCDVLAAWRDGRSVCFGGTRDNPKGRPGRRDEFIGEVVACDVAGPRLRRRWGSTFPLWSDSVRALACSGGEDGDGGSVVVLRAQVGKGAGRALLMRFPRDSATPARERAVAGEPACLAASGDGTRVAVALHDRTLHILDGDFHALATHALPGRPRSLRFLGTGQLLVGTDDALLRLDPATGQVIARAPGEAFRIAADDAERTVVASRWFPLTGPERDAPAPFGLRVLSLPDLGLVRTLEVPGHQLVAPAFSGDGRLVACLGREVGRPRYGLLVLDAATGREVARRKSDSISPLAFLPGGHMLAIGTSGHTTGEPIELWPVP